MSDPLLLALASNTALAGLLGFAGWCLAHVARRPAAAHALFVLALLKLVTPPLWSVGWLPTAAASGSAGEVRVEPSDPPVARPRVAPAPPLIADRSKALVPAAAIATVTPDRPAPDQPTPGGTARSALLTLWIAGTAVAGLLGLRRIGRFRSALRAARAPDAALAADIHAAQRRIGLRRAPRVRVVTAVVPPLVFASGLRATLVIPATWFASLDRDARVALLSHELAHVRRGDVWLRWFETAVRIAMWWHPLCWWLSREVRAAEERACDAAVTVGSSPTARRRYADALLAAASRAGTSPSFTCPAVRHSARLRPWKRRLEDVMNAETASRSPLSIRLAILALGGLLAPLAIAQDGDAPSRQGLAERLEHTELELEIANANLEAWTGHLAKTARLNIVIERSLVERDAEAGPRGALRLPKTSVRRILDVLTALTDVRWSIEGDILRLRAAEQKPAARPGDGARTVTVHGAVVAPGRVALGPDETMLELLMRIERTDTADLSAVRLLRTGAAPLSLVVDVDGMLRTGETAQNLVLRSDDVVTVPDQLPADLPPLTLRPGVELRFVVDPQIASQPGMEQLALLTERQRVQRDGTIFVPYIGPMTVNGMTRDEVTEAVSALLYQGFAVPVRVWARLD